MVWNVWNFTEKNYILERFFRLTEIAFFLLPISAIVFTFVIGAKAVNSTNDGAEQAGAAIGMAIGGTFIVILAFIIGLIGGIIMHLITNKYDKKAEASGEKQAETLANKHGIILSVVGIIGLAIILGTASGAKNETKNNIPVSDENKPVVNEAKSVEQKIEENKVDLEITKKGFKKADYVAGTYQDQITMDLKFINKTEKNIKGVQGVVTFSDMFDNEIKAIKIAYDKGILAGQDKVWNSASDYNQFIDEDTKLKDTELKDLKYIWKVDTIVYEDGSKEIF